MNEDFHDRINKIKALLLDNQNSYKKSNILKQEISTVLKSNLVSEQELDGNYNEITDDLRRRLILLKQRSIDQVKRVKVLKNTIENQVGELRRLEVDIDMKVRACKGSCARVYNYAYDTESYANIRMQLTQSNSIDIQPAVQDKPLKVLKMRPLKDSTVPSHFKTSPLVSEEEAHVLDRIKIMIAALEDSEAESRTSPVASKDVVPGAEAAGSVSYSKGVSGTVRGGSDLKIVRPASTPALACMRTVTKKTIHSASGTREEVVEEYKAPDGSDCSHLKGLVNEAKGTHYVKVSTSSGGGSGLPDLSSLDPSAREFFNFGSAIKLTGTTGHTPPHHGSHSNFDLHEEEVDDFSRLDHESAMSHSSTSHSTSSKSVVISSKGGSASEFKSARLAPFREVEGVQHDESGEDTPDFRARSSSAVGVKMGESYTGTGIHP